MTERVLWLEDLACLQSEVAGGKGASLGRMRAVGMPVPPAFVVGASALRDTLGSRGVLAEVQRLATSYGGGDDTVSPARIRELVLSAPPDPTLAEEIADAYTRLGDTSHVAVRSSACAEDGENASFAGQQETFLNVVGREAVLEKVVECWASFFSERAMFYRKSKGSLADMGMAVVVQRQLSSDKSGVMFTVDPIRQRRDQMVIEAAYGLGEALVSGLVTPDNYVARRDGTVKTVRVGRQDRMMVRAPEGGVATLELDENMATAQVLDDGEIERLVTIGRELEDAFGAPQDVEWAFEADELYVLQSRPVTA
ncbi:MAG TPA: PEP/pyruvate-binding domain-containing protein [Acidimicrobiia bacterium]